jgi:hypothetical protein
LVWVKTECFGLLRKEPGSVLLQLVENRVQRADTFVPGQGVCAVCVFPLSCV